MRHAFVLLLCLAATAARAADDIIPLSQIHPGMRGYGLSVFKGTTIERFEVEVVDILPQADLDGSWIMVRFLRGPMIDRGSGVIAGMSGSPVYFEDRLAGAVAYGFTWALDPVCFLTPIEQMLSVLDEADEPLPETRSAGRVIPLPRPVTVDGHARSRMMLADQPLPAGYEPPDDLLAVEPLMAPVMVSGLSPSGVAAVSQLLAPYRLRAVQGPGGGGMGGAVDLQPGSAMGVSLVSGDVSLTGTGTVTCRRGDRVLGFGHPMMQRNRVALPLCGAYVVDFFSSRQRSFKLSAALDPVGTLDQDGHFGVVGRLGQPAPTFPLTVTVRDRDRGQSKVIRCQVTQDRDLAPGLVQAVAQDVVGTWCGLYPPTMVSVRTEVGIQGVGPVVRQELGMVDGPVLPAAMADLLPTLQLVVQNPYRKLSLTGVELEVELARGDDTATIQRAYVDRSVVEPGDTITVELRLLRRSNGEVTRRTMTITVPEDAPPGKTRLAVGGGVGESGMTGLLKLLAPPANDLQQVFERFAETDGDSRRLVAKLALPTNDLAVRGFVFPRPPGLVAELLGQSGTTDLAQGQAAITVSEPCDLVVLNGAVGQVQILKPGEAPSEGNNQPKQNAIEVLPALPVEPLLMGPVELDVTPEWLALAVGPLQAGGPPARRPNGAPGGPPAGGQPGGPPQGGQQPPQPQEPGVRSRSGRLFVHNAAKDFFPAEVEQTTVVHPGSVVLGLGEQELTKLPEPIIWDAAVDVHGTTWLATGDDGELWKIPRDGEPTVAWRSDQPAVTAVACAGENVFVGTAPDGKLLKVTDGQATVVGETGSAYIWDMLPTQEGGVLVATGAPAALWIYHAEKFQLVRPFGSGHLLALAAGPENSVLIGAEPGRVLRFRGGQVEELVRCDTPVQAVAVLGNGTVLYGNGPAVGRIHADGRHDLLKPMDGPSIVAIRPTKFGVLVAVKAKSGAEPASVWVINPEGEERRRAFLTEAAAVTCLELAGDDVIAGTSCPALAYRLSLPFAKEGTYESPVLDAGGPASWGRVEVTGKVPPETGFSVETRSGNSPRPGDDWSGWIGGSEKVASPSARYLQYRLKLHGNGQATPEIENVRIFYMPANIAPEFSFESPTVGEAWRGKQSIKWKGQDANGDEPLVTIQIRALGSQEWTMLGVDIEARQAKLDIDTTRFKDGRYQLRMIADDSVYNPDDPRHAIEHSDIFSIDNTAPTVVLAPEEEWGVGEDGRLRGTATVQDNLMVAGAEWRIGEGPWRPAVAVDGVFDSPLERVRLMTHRLPEGKQVLELRVRDTAGNEASVKREVEGRKAEG